MMLMFTVSFQAIYFVINRLRSKLSEWFAAAAPRAPATAKN
ncbi:MAG: hypothetical protein V4772_11900 [Pseudomonadota bacterium]